MYGVHLVFHVVKLWPVVTNPIPGQQTNLPLPLVIMDNEEHYVVKVILDSHIFHYKLQYWVKEKGYGYEDAF